MAHLAEEDGSLLLNGQDQPWEAPCSHAWTAQGRCFAKQMRISKASIGAVACVGLLAALYCSLRSDGQQISAPGNLTSSASDKDPFELLLERELFDVSLFDQVGVPYSSEPEEAKVVTTTCVIDVVQATMYLGNAIVYIYRAAICPDPEPLTCTEPVAYAVTALTWLGSFLAAASTTCAESLSPANACVAATLRDLAAAGSTIFGFKEDCYLTRPLMNSRVFQERRKIPPILEKIYSLNQPFPDENPRRLMADRSAASDPSHEIDTQLVRRKSAEVRGWLRNSSGKRPDAKHAALPNVLFEASTAGIDTRVLGIDDTIDKIRNITRRRNARTERNFAIANCAFNSVDAAAWLIRAFLSIRDAAKSCGDRKECAIDILYVIGSFSYTAQMLSLCFVDCPWRGKREAMCGANVADVVGSMAIFVASIIQAIGYCSDAWPNQRP